MTRAAWPNRGLALRDQRSRSGFTIMELLLIVVIMAIIATTAVPMISQASDARQAAARDEVVRLFEFARGRAMASGMPVGVEIDTASSSLRLVTINTAGGIVELADSIGGGTMGSSLTNEFSGVTIDSFVNGDGASGDGTVWFDFLATPHLRNDVSGAFDEVFSRVSTLTLSTGGLVIVHADSGFVEAQ